MIASQERQPLPESYFSAFWLALALTLTMAQQLRISNVFRHLGVATSPPIGPGELLGFLWISWALWHHFIVRRRGINRTTAGIAVYSLMAIAVMFAGILSALYLNLWDSWGWRDFLSISFILALLFTFSLRFNDLKSLERFCLALLAITALYVLPLFLLSRFITHIGPFSLYFDEGFSRFAALANYPGQIDYFLVALPFLSLHFLARSKGVPARTVFLLLGTAAVSIGIDNNNDSFMVGLLAGFMVATIVLWLKLIAHLKQHHRPVALAAVLLTVLLLIGVSAPFYGKFEAYGRHLFEANNYQGRVRVTLAMHALEAASYSPVVGLGPGKHSGLAEPFLRSEGHNVLADIAAGGGLLGVTIFICFVAWNGWRCWRTRFAWLNGAFAAMLIFSMFNYTLRHPLYLLGLLMISRLAVMLRRKSTDEAQTLADSGGSAPHSKETSNVYGENDKVVFRRSP